LRIWQSRNLNPGRREEEKSIDFQLALSIEVMPPRTVTSASGVLIVLIARGSATYKLRKSRRPSIVGMPVSLSGFP
jgi:hypothetical protein